MKKQFRTKKSTLALGSINVDSAYQRKLDMGWVSKLVADFDPVRLGLPDISEREDGTFWAIDGQHRINACRVYLGDGWERQHVECLVYSGMTLEDEAEFFYWRNYIKPLKPFARFRARLVSGEAVAIAVYKTAKDAGFTIAEGNDALSCVAVMESIYRGARAANALDGPANLARTLAVVAKAWGLKSPHPNGHVIQGLGMFIERFSHEIDMGRLVKKLAEYPGGFSGLLGKSRALRDIQGGQVSHAVFELIRRDFNIGLKGKKLNALRKEDEQ